MWRLIFFLSLVPFLVSFFSQENSVAYNPPHSITPGSFLPLPADPLCGLKIFYLCVGKYPGFDLSMFLPKDGKSHYFSSVHLDIVARNPDTSIRKIEVRLHRLSEHHKSCFYITPGILPAITRRYNVPECRQYRLNVYFASLKKTILVDEIGSFPVYSYKEFLSPSHLPSHMAQVIQFSCAEIGRYNKDYGKGAPIDFSKLYCKWKNPRIIRQCSKDSCIDKCDRYCHFVYMLKPEPLRSQNVLNTLVSEGFEQLPWTYDLSQMTKEALLVCWIKSESKLRFTLDDGTKSAEIIPDLLNSPNRTQSCGLLFKRDIHILTNDWRKDHMTLGVEFLPMPNSGGYKVSDLKFEELETHEILPLQKGNITMTVTSSRVTIFQVPQACRLHGIYKVLDREERYTYHQNYYMDNICRWVFWDISPVSTDAKTEFVYHIYPQRFLSVDNPSTQVSLPAMIYVRLNPFNAKNFTYICFQPIYERERFSLNKSSSIIRFTSQGVVFPIKYYFTRFSKERSTGGAVDIECVYFSLGELGVPFLKTLKAENWVVSQPNPSSNRSVALFSPDQEFVQILITLNASAQSYKINLIETNLINTEGSSLYKNLESSHPFLAVHQTFDTPYYSFAIISPNAFYTEVEKFTCVSCTCCNPPCPTSSNNKGYYRVFAMATAENYETTILPSDNFSFLTSSLTRLSLPQRGRTFFYNFDSPITQISWSVPTTALSRQFLLTFCLPASSMPRYNILNDMKFFIHLEYLLTIPLDNIEYFYRLLETKEIQTCIMILSMKFLEHRRIRNYFHENLDSLNNLDVVLKTHDITLNQLSVHVAETYLSEKQILSGQPITIEMQPQISLTFPEYCSYSTRVFIQTPLGPHYRQVSIFRWNITSYEAPYNDDSACSISLVWQGPRFARGTMATIRLINHPDLPKP